MKNKLSTIILSVVFLAGLSLILYPSVSNYWNSLHASKAVANYDENVQNINEDEYENMLKNAHAYNKALFERNSTFYLTSDLKEKYDNLLNIGDNGIMGYIEIPNINISLPIYHGIDDSVLQIAVGHLDWTSLPVGGESTHCVLSGHRGLPSAKLFTNLDQLVEGDTFVIRVLNEVLTYEVDQILIVEPENTDSLLIEKGKDLCTLVTCTPYGINSHRLLVRGHRVETKNETTIRVVSDAIRIEPLVVAPIVAVPILLAFIILVFTVNPKKKKKKKKEVERMKRKNNHVFAIIFCVAAIMFSTVVSAFAIVKIDIGRSVSLKIEYLSEGTPVSGAEFSLYKIADINESAEIIPCDEFLSYPVDIAGQNEKEWNALAKTLVGYIRLNNIAPVDSGTTDKDGVVVFPNKAKKLDVGIYLVLAKQHIQDETIYKCEPFIVSLPGYDKESDTYIYDVTCEPKHAAEKPESDMTKRKVIKIWKGDNELVRPSEVLIDILKDDEIYESVVLNNENNWTYEWPQLQKYNDDGTEIEWTMVENVPDGYNVLLEQETTTMIITNTYSPDEPESRTTERSVQKIWDDKGYEKKRPKSITVELLKNGTVFDSVVLSEESGWIYKWDNLEKFDQNNDYITWSINEKTVKGYKSSVVLNGYTFVLTNTYDHPYIPRTGVLWWPVPMIAGAGVLCFMVGILIKKRNENEE